MGKWTQYPMSSQSPPPDGGYASTGKERTIMKEEKKREDKTKLPLLLRETDELISIIFTSKETAKKKMHSKQNKIELSPKNIYSLEIDNSVLDVGYSSIIFELQV